MITRERIKLWPWGQIIRVVGVFIVIVIAVLIFRHFFILPDRLRQQNAENKQDVKAATGEVQVTKETMQTMQNRTVTIDKQREIIRENTREIRTAPGASNETPDAVHNAFERSIGRLREQADQRERPADQLPRARP